MKTAGIFYGNVYISKLVMIDCESNQHIPIKPRIIKKFALIYYKNNCYRDLQNGCIYLEKLKSKPNKEYVDSNSLISFDKILKDGMNDDDLEIIPKYISKRKVLKLTRDALGL